MAIGIQLEVRQSQQLVMTPQLQQAIKLLQMSNLELSAFVASEVESNPLIEIADASADNGGPDQPADPDHAPAADGGEAPDLTQSLAEPGRADDLIDSAGASVFDDGPTEGGPGESGLGDGSNGPGHTGSAGGRQLSGELDGDGLDRIAQTRTLREHLREQIQQMRCPQITAQIALLLIEELDPAGYLRTDTGELAERMEVSTVAMGAAVSLLQSCEPAGIGARHLGECLQLQLQDRNRFDPAMEALLDHLELVGKGKLAQLEKICGVEREDLRGMLAELRALDPFPGHAFETQDPETLIPDLFLRRTSWAGWQIELNSETLPRVLYANRYAAQLGGADQTTREFIATCHANANWLIKSLDQRAKTILKVATEIVRRQEAFFEKGVAGLQPMTMKMVADEISMHESTVSRVTSGKYIATDRGTFELKFFFTNSVGPDDSLSAEAVRDRIKRMIEQETPGDILSDDTIVEQLQKAGIDIARRTVAKYRKSLNIPSSVERRRRSAVANF